MLTFLCVYLNNKKLLAEGGETKKKLYQNILKDSGDIFMWCFIYITIYHMDTWLIRPRRNVTLSYLYRTYWVYMSLYMYTDIPPFTSTF